ncbi:MAG: GTPase HflX [Christensenella sp.]|uniref:GTPase HflX n=1 Tax=Christensenella sp. TaxID=1935934 RepID=UPI002B22120A|nr:GTPase HflX [Christensenella sp.]MEA5003295.1 GTPase HflX [Christensenella sp.]
MEINGNKQGIRNSVLKEMEQLYEHKMTPQEFVSEELLRDMARFTQELGKEISVFLSRNGRVMDVSIGDSDSVQMPYMRERRSFLGLSGIRALHTHPNGSAMLSDVDIGSLKSSKFDAMAAISVKEGKATAMTVGFIGDKLDEVAIAGPFRPGRIPQRALMNEIGIATQRVSALIALKETGEETERVMLLGLNASDASMEELRRLALTAGADIVASETQQRDRDHAYYIGKGKARELSLAVAAMDVDTVIVNDELTPLETRNLEETLGLKVVDRTMLILDIFAKHARTREGSLQVELAQLKYALPRLQGEGTALSRLGGGIGTRGPGEKKIEVDRRRIRRRIFELTGETEKIREQRSLRRNARKEKDVAEVALVGYTNAGKSSILNYLTNAGVLAEDKLFATLDPVTRKVGLSEVGEVVFTDTVGFIEKLPHDLVSAFRSTLEEAKNADVLLCVTDASNPDAHAQMEVVDEVLRSLEADDKPRIVVMNKIDKMQGDIPPNDENTVYVSARTGEGMDELLARTALLLQPELYSFCGKIGYERGDLLALVNKHGKDITLEYEPQHIVLSAKLPRDVIRRIGGENGCG